MITVALLLLLIRHLASMPLVEHGEESKKFSLVNPSTTIKVEQVGSDVNFHFSFSNDFGADQKNAANERIVHVVLLDAIGEEIWKIEAPPNNRGSATIAYGIVPKNFAQLIPKSGNPPS